jgi:hypothetical protein
VNSSEAVENSIRVNSWNSWRLYLLLLATNSTNFTKTITAIWMSFEFAITSIVWPRSAGFLDRAFE